MMGPRWLVWALCLLLAGCSAAPFDTREQAQVWARGQGWQVLAQPADPLAPLALLRQRGGAARLTLYIEGDGAPWPSLRQPPANPTPRRALVLSLAEQDPAAAVAYLGRPCQYLPPAELRQCSPQYWTTRRFAPEVLLAMDQAVSRLKRQAGAERLRLVGYSGGGVLATLLAQRRTDVEQLVTLAAPLALNEWVQLLQLSPLQGSLDPLDGPPPAAQAWHFSGSADRLVPTAVAAHFVARQGGRLERLSGFDHACCWGQHWPALLAALEDEP
jgi:hypothetical protein